MLKFAKKVIIPLSLMLVSAMYNPITTKASTAEDNINIQAVNPSSSTVTKSSSSASIFYKSSSGVLVPVSVPFSYNFIIYRTYYPDDGGYTLDKITYFCYITKNAGLYSFSVYAPNSSTLKLNGSTIGSVYSGGLPKNSSVVSSDWVYDSRVWNVSRDYNGYSSNSVSANYYAVDSGNGWSISNNLSASSSDF